MKRVLASAVVAILAASAVEADAQDAFQSLAISKMRAPPPREPSALTNLAVLSGVGPLDEKPLNADDLAQLKTKAAAGDVAAMHALARLALNMSPFYPTETTWKDPQEAARWWRKAAGLGDVKAMILLGNLYAAPWGVPQDYDQAETWFRKAADKGSAEAARDLASLYLGLWTDRRDEAQANVWVGRMADAGDVDSMLLMGVRYDIGWGVAKDDAQARRWYEKVLAATEGKTTRTTDRADALVNLGVMQQEGRGGFAPDAANAAESYRKAIETAGWQLRAEYDLALLCEAGRGLPRDPDGAAWLYRDVNLMSRFQVRNLARDGLKRLGLVLPANSAEFNSEAGALLTHNKLPASERGCLAGEAKVAQTTATPPPLREGVPPVVEGIRYRDPGTGETYQVEIDGRHIDAYSTDGKPLWRHDPFVENKLQPYRNPRPTIVALGPISKNPVKGAPDGRYLSVIYNSSQFGGMDVTTGRFVFWGQD